MFGRLPQAQFERVGAAAVAARDKGVLGGGNHLQRRNGVMTSSDVRGISLRAEDDEIIQAIWRGLIPCPSSMNLASASGS